MFLVSMITFRAKRINPVYIKRYNPVTLKYEKCPAAFIRLDKKSAADYEAVNNLPWIRGAGQKYAAEIVANFNSEYNKKRNVRRDNFYALTLQTDNFDHLDSGRILGLAEAAKNRGSVYLDFLQINPKYKFGIAQREYKEVGKSIIDGFKCMRGVRRIFAVTNAFVSQFYADNGFEQDGSLVSWVKHSKTGFFSNLLSKLEFRMQVKAGCDEHKF